MTNQELQFIKDVYTYCGDKNGEFAEGLFEIIKTYEYRIGEFQKNNRELEKTNTELREEMDKRDKNFIQTRDNLIQKFDDSRERNKEQAERIKKLEEVLNSVYDSRAYDIIIHYDAELAKRINRLLNK